MRIMHINLSINLSGLMGNRCVLRSSTWGIRTYGAPGRGLSPQGLCEGENKEFMLVQLIRSSKLYVRRILTHVGRTCGRCLRKIVSRNCRLVQCVSSRVG